MYVSMLRGYHDEININNFFHQKNVVADYEDILNDIDTIIRSRKDISDNRLNARIFINNGTRDDFGNRVSSHPPKKEENIQNWLERITGAISFCAVINGLNGWSDRLADRINKNFNEEWVQRFGIPSQGIDVYTFMGKYTLTPFGIHNDQEHTFLYHLGPGIKKAWIWNPNKIDITPLVRDNSFNLEETLSHAYQITMNPGDALFIPQNWFHVLENPEFSVTLGIAPYEKKKSELLTSFLKDAIAESTDEDNSIHINTCEKKRKMTAITDIIPSSLSNCTLAQITKTGLTQLINTLKSNQYFKYSPPERTLKTKHYQYNGGIVLGEDDGHITKLYCRGKVLLIKSELRNKVLHFISLIRLSGVYYDKSKEQSDDFLSVFIKSLIRSGALK